MKSLFDGLPDYDDVPDQPADGLAEGERRRNRGCRRGRGKNPDLAERLARAFLCLLRDGGPSTTDPLRAAVPLPPGQDPRIVGSSIRPLIDDGVIRVVGRAKSQRPEAHGRTLDVWAIADVQKANTLIHQPKPASGGEVSE